MKNVEYASVYEHLANNPDFANENNVTFNLYDGSQLKNIVPLTIVETTLNGGAPNNTTLMLYYLDSGGSICEIPIDRVCGLRVSVGLQNSPFPGRLLVQGDYLSSRDNQPEKDPRNFKFIQFDFGIHENHAKVGETKPDYYMVGYEQKYLLKNEALEDSVRRYPLWRLGVYGQALAQLPNFIQQVK